MYKFKYWASALVVSALSLPALAQDASGSADAAFTTFMTEIQNNITAKVSAMLPVLGAVAGVAMVIFLAIYVYRKIKSFMGR